MIKGNPRFGYELTCDICGDTFENKYHVYGVLWEG